MQGRLLCDLGYHAVRANQDKPVSFVQRKHPAPLRQSMHIRGRRFDYHEE